MTKKFPGLADAIFTPSQPSVTREYDMNQANLNAFADGEYRIVLRDWKQPPHDYYRYYGHTEIVTIQDHKMVGTGTHIDQAKMAGSVIHTIKMELKQETNIFAVLIEEEYIM